MAGWRLRLRVVPVLLGTCGALLALSSSASALIAFQSQRCESDIQQGVPLRDQPPSFADCGPAIWTMNDDGSNPRRITEPENLGTSTHPTWYGDGEPSLSPSGRFIAASRADPHEGGSRLFVYAATGAWGRDVSPPWSGDDGVRMDLSPSWSPDERTLVFTSTRPDPSGRLWDVHTLDLGTGAIARITSDDGRKLGPRFSPDGDQIVFARDFWVDPWADPERTRENSALAGAFAVDASDGRNLRRLTTPGFGGGSPAFSPDGERVAFQGMGGLYVMRVNGAEMRLIVRDEPRWRGAIDVGWTGQQPAWADHGSSVVFRGCKELDDGRGGCAIFRQRLDAASPEQLTNWSRDSDPSWAPGGPADGDAGPADDAAPALGLMNTDTRTTTVAAGSTSARASARRVFKARRDNLAYLGTDGTGLRRIDASISYVRRDGRCGFLTRRGDYAPRRCGRPIYFRVTNPARWRGQVEQLDAGRRYTVRLRARDVLGNRTARPRSLTVALTG